MNSRTQILRPLQRPRLEFFDLPGGEPVRGVVLILVPVRADEPVPEVFEAELGGCDGGPVIRGRRWSGDGRQDVDEVADGAAVGESADLGADHVVKGKNGAVGGLGGRSPERLLEDVDLALLAGVRIGDEEPTAERIGLNVRGPPSARTETCRESGDDHLHRSGILGGDVEVAAEAFDQAVGLHGVPAGEDQG